MVIARLNNLTYNIRKSMCLSRMIRFYLVLAAALSLGSAAEPDTEIEGLVDRLDDERFAVRDSADRILREIGKAALPALRRASESDSPEKRVRARTLVQKIQREIVRREFERMGKLADADLEVERAMWAVSLFLDPELEQAQLARSLDEIALAVRKRIGEDRKPQDLPPADAMKALIFVLKEEFLLSGDIATYQHPDNSSAYRVLRRKKGLPILLSEIAVAVARRLELPVVGLGIPGRYMIKYDGGRAPGEEPGSDIIINPFEQWREMTIRDLVFSVPGFDADEHLQELPVRLKILRIMRNMESHALVTGRRKLQEEIRACYTLLAGPGAARFR